MTFFLDALSAKLIAVLMSLSFLLFPAMRKAISSLEIRLLLTFCFLNDPRNARFAVFVTGILIRILKAKDRESDNLLH